MKHLSACVGLALALASCVGAGAPGGVDPYPYPGSPGPGGVGDLLGQGDSTYVLPPPELPPPSVVLVPLPRPAAPRPQPPERPRARVHRVVRGDTLWAIAERYCGSGFQWKQIYYANRDKIRNPHWIYPGQEFVVPCGDGGAPGGAPPYPDPKGGSPGYPDPGKGGTGPIGADARPTGPQFAWIRRNPLPPGSYRVSSRFGDARDGGRSHQGVDLATRPGARPQIGAVAEGRVVTAGWVSGYGYVVYVQHPNGYQTRYAHMAPPGPAVRVGQYVQPGQVLGRVNSTGNSTGDHLHFEIRRGDRALNPQACMHF